ncbi:peptidoglycan-binding domain-containing protein [Terrarubrum flagellatum]|uniref:peptidoglycan-binding domain-containing protein n=1 Tax=Terrirubrum flagellatum TaxID=2895980 RepID=UPI0031453C5C
MATLISSVGFGQRNFINDVKLVQSLLNFAPPERGGPAKALRVDGLFGTFTDRAVRGFQSSQLGFDDGVIDPDGPTLGQLLSFFSEIPKQAAKIFASLLVFTTGATVSRLKILNASGLSATLGALALQGQTLEIGDGFSRSKKFQMQGVGLGLSWPPVKFRGLPISDILPSVQIPIGSFPSAPPANLLIPKGKPDATFETLQGLGVTMDAGVSLGVSASMTFVFFNVLGGNLQETLTAMAQQFPLPGIPSLDFVAKLFAASSAAGVAAGTSVTAGVPGVSVTGQEVAIRDSRTPILPILTPGPLVKPAISSNFFLRR